MQCANSPYSMSFWKRLEDLIYFSTEDSIKEAKQMIMNNAELLSSQYIANLVSRVTKYRPFKYNIIRKIFDGLFYQNRDIANLGNHLYCKFDLRYLHNNK